MFTPKLLSCFIASSSVFLAFGGVVFLEQSKMFQKYYSPSDSTNLSCKNLKSLTDPYSQATLITTAIFSSENVFLGSGTLFQIIRSNQTPFSYTYQVVTNRHLFERDDLKSSSSIQVQTWDGQRYPANLKKYKSSGEDLALLEFKTNYPCYKLANHSSALAPNQPIFAGGWIEGSNRSQSFIITTGIFTHQLSHPLQGGYQLGYTNAVLWGMSGGPVLDSQGNLLGINAITENNNVGELRRFEDKSVPPTELARVIHQNSWAIPTERLNRFILEP